MPTHIVIHTNCPKLTGPGGTLLAYMGTHAPPSGSRYYCEACGVELVVIDIGAEAEAEGKK